MRGSNDVLSSIHENCLNIRNNIIYLSQEDQDDDTINHKIASRFIKNLDYISSINQLPITVKIISNGGDICYGLAIFDAIQDCPSYVTTISCGQAVSMSSVIPQAADERIIQKNCIFMAHYGSFFQDSDFKSAYSQMAFYHKTWCENLIDIYSKRCINGEHFRINNMQSEKRVQKFIKDKLEKHVDWFLDAEESVYYGFMDKVQ